MAEIVFDQLIPMPAVTWKRPRIQGVIKADFRIHYRIYNDKGYEHAKANLGWEIKAAAPKLRCSAKERFGFAATFHLIGPRGGDGDRYENLVMDALQGIVWENDNQVDEARWAKTYDNATPGIWLTIWRIV